MQQIYVLKFILILKFLWHSTKTNSDPGTSYFVNKKNSFRSKMIYKRSKNVVLFMSHLKLELHILLYCKINYTHV